MIALIRLTLSTLPALCLLSACLTSETGHRKEENGTQNWPVVNGDAKAQQYSSLRQINRSNVKKLSLSWSYASASGQPIPAASELQVNPLIIDGVLYGRSPNYNVFALNAASGEEIWTYDPEVDPEVLAGLGTAAAA